jgi:hypothetical protein
VSSAAAFIDLTIAVVIDAITDFYAGHAATGAHAHHWVTDVICTRTVFIDTIIASVNAALMYPWVALVTVQAKAGRRTIWAVSIAVSVAHAGNATG